jgi:PTS system galactitol-specific IIA component
MDEPHSLNVVEELCLLRPEATTSEALLEIMGERAVEAGFASPSFTTALIEREGQYPTGLPLPVPAAIPHTDPQHVLRSGLAVALVDPPIRFGEMGTADGTVDCRLVVMLLVGSPQQQVAVLGRVIKGLQQPVWPELLAASTDGQDLGRRFATLVS